MKKLPLLQSGDCSRQSLIILSIYWYSLTPGMISNGMVDRNHIIQNTPCSLGSELINIAREQCNTGEQSAAHTCLDPSSRQHTASQSLSQQPEQTFNARSQLARVQNSAFRRFVMMQEVLQCYSTSELDNLMSATTKILQHSFTALASSKR